MPRQANNSSVNRVAQQQRYQATRPYTPPPYTPPPRPSSSSYNRR